MAGKKLKIKVVPNAKKERVKQEGDRWKVYVTAPPVDGKANKALIETLARHFNLKKRSFRLIKGGKSRTKIIEVLS